MTAQDLKNSILQLAIQGKLVEQRSEEGTAEELYQRIQAEKKKLIEDGKIVVDKKHSPKPISEDDILYDLPGSWCWVRFADLALFSSGKTPERHSTDYWNSNEYTWVSIADMVSGGITIESKEKISQSALDDCFLGKLIPAGTMIMSFKLTIGKISILGVDAVHNEAIISIFPYIDDEILKKYLFKVLPLIANKGNTKNAVKGKTLNATSISNLMIPLPPSAEQKRIVTKIEELMPLVEEYGKAEEQLTALDSEFPNKLRKSILQQAIQGKLTERDPTDESASELLNRIRAEKQRLIKEGKLKKEKSLPRITEDDILFEIPEGWSWVRLTDVGEVARGRSKHRPRNDHILYDNGIYPFIQTGDVARSNGQISTCSAFYNEIGLAQSRMWSKGTLCMTIAANIADVGILDFNACFPDSVVGFNAFKPIENNNYFLYMLTAYKNILDCKATKSAQKNINLETIASLTYPLPPLAEQKRIVQKLEEILPLCGKLK